MINNFVLNSDLYSETFSIYDDIDMKLDKIMSNIRSVPKSKMKISSSNGRDVLLVDKNFYDMAMDEGMKFIVDNGLDDWVYWNCNGFLTSVGYYPVGVASRFSDDMIENIKFSTKMFNDIAGGYHLKYDRISKKYVIFLEGNNHDALVNKFNQFLRNNGIYPFIEIEVTSRYGKRDGRSYPILTKRK